MKMTENKIVVCGEVVNAYNCGYDTNGNRKWVVWFGSLYDFIANQIGNPEYEPLKRVDAEYTHVLNALRGIGGKKYNNRQFGGGIVFTGADISTLGAEITTAIDLYARWYNSEHISPQMLNVAIERTISTLPIVVKSTNRGITVKGEYMNTLELKINVDYDHNITSTENYIRAAMLWCAKAEFKRWQIEGEESKLLLRNAYTAIDANTRVFMYQIA